MEIILDGDNCQFEVGQTVSGRVLADDDIEPTNIKIELIGSEEVSWVPHLYGRDKNVIRIAQPLQHKTLKCLELVYELTEQGIYHIFYCMNFKTIII